MAFDPDIQMGLTEEQGNDLSNCRASACALRDIVEEAREAARHSATPNGTEVIVLSDACDRAIAGMIGWS